MANILPCLRTSLVSGSIALVFLVGLPALILLAILGILREVDPPGSTLIWGQRLTGTAIDQRCLPISQISPFLVRAVIASEDNQFCRHRGIDVIEMEAVLEQAGGPEDVTRGGSTITMQVAKNLFLWNSRSYVRKGIEIPIALAIERMWSKQRIMEVYLNIAEWGPGVFGAEAAAQYYFRKPAHRLSEREAALLAVALPNPMVRLPNRPSAHMLKVTGVVERRARLAATRMSCALRR
jgi:monofunctional biosynthetic peptidoglycan transglycosylase